MKVLIATGGSGGHIFPALATAHHFRAQGHEVSLAGVFGLWAERVAKGPFPLTEISARGLNTRCFSSVGISSIYMLKSLRESVILLRQQAPQVVLGFGGYAAFPVVLAAFFLRIPTMIHEQNACPGRANRLLKYGVNRIAVSFDETRRYFPPQKTVVTGYPLYRWGDPVLKKAEAAAVFGLKSDIFTILVLGGSQGSQAINRCFVDASAAWKTMAPFQVIHITGRKDYREVLNAYGDQGRLSFVTPFWDNMPAAYRAADLVVSRSGAGTINEIAAYGLRAVLIPYPHAQGHQIENAQILIRAGKAQMIEQKDLTPDKLGDTLQSLYKVTQGAGDARQPDTFVKADAAERILREVLELQR